MENEEVTFSVLEGAEEEVEFILNKDLIPSSVTLKNMHEDADEFAPRQIVGISPDQFQHYFCSYAPLVKNLLNCANDEPQYTVLQKQLYEKVGELADTQLASFTFVNDFLDVEELINPATSILAKRLMDYTSTVGISKTLAQLNSWDLLPAIKKRVNNHIIKVMATLLTAKNIALHKAMTDGSITALKFRPNNNKQLISVAWDKSIDLWDIALLKPRKIFSRAINATCSVDFHPTGDSFVCGHNDGSISVFDLDGNRKEVVAGSNFLVNDLVFSKDGKYFVTFSSDKLVRLWDASTYACLKQMSQHTNWVEAIDFSPDSSTVASGSRDKSIILWNVEKDAVKILSDNSNAITAVSFSPNGKYLVSGSVQGLIKLWNFPSCTVNKEMRNHLEALTAFAFSQDNEVLFSGSLDKTINVWDVNAGVLLRRLSEQLNGVNAISLNSDGTLMASSNFDEIIKIWKIVDAKKLLEQLNAQQILFIFDVYQAYKQANNKKLVVCMGTTSPNNDVRAALYKTITQDVQNLIKPCIVIKKS